ncbi:MULTISPECIES: ribokinase [unclassified Microbacterium]|uniref:ribokinase n=1 Tax=unclassified Microbacterium TaxID=2609290 RepID=UPI0021A2E496|nr:MULTISPECIES: ribokinase [unclassified Microbacterium]MCT1365256.1 ribokinase [Microbacterium sp. p3-SID131]MCT1376046.1 ribokinase [Microbacterium sp. p3-SID337]
MNVKPDAVLAPSLVVVGSANVDLTAFVDRLPTAGETVAGGRLSRDLGGKGANQAVAAAKLGGRVRMVGAVGADADGTWMRDELGHAGVDTAHLRTVAAPTGTALIVVGADAENQIAVCPGANELVSLEGVAVGPDEAVLLQLEIAMSVVESVVARAEGFVAVNAAPAQPLPDALLQRVDLFIVNETERELMPELADAALVAVTYGAAGAALFRGGEEIARADGVPTRALNTVGAGDAFCAALVLALQSGLPAQSALQTACAVGAAAVAHLSSQPPFDPLARYVPAP